jgi:hypothetical protein
MVEVDIFGSEVESKRGNEDTDEEVFDSKTKGQCAPMVVEG